MDKQILTSAPCSGDIGRYGVGVFKDGKNIKNTFQISKWEDKSCGLLLSSKFFKLLKKVLQKSGIFAGPWWHNMSVMSYKWLHNGFSDF